jgi:hypothetical protein
MIDDLNRLVLWHLGVEQGRAATLREFFTTGATAEESDGIMAIDFADHEIALASLTIARAFGIAAC